jgi:hypothetical protein
MIRGMVGALLDRLAAAMERGTQSYLAGLGDHDEIERAYFERSARDDAESEAA